MKKFQQKQKCFFFFFSETRCIIIIIACVVERFLSNYQSLDESLAVIMAKINEKSNKTPGKSFMTAMTSDFNDEDLTTVAIPKRESTESQTKHSVK